MGAPAWCAVPLAMMWLAYPLSIAKVHPLLHVPEEEAKEMASPLLKRVLESRWAAWASRNHELHHEAECNYTLSFPGADALLGTLVQPNLQDLFRMRDDGARHF